MDDIQIVNDPGTRKAVIYIATGEPCSAVTGKYHCFSMGIYKSADMGRSFQPIGNFNSDYHFDFAHGKFTYKIAVSPVNAGIIFVASSDGLYRTMDGGNTWQLVLADDHPAGCSTPGIWSVTFSPSNPDVVYAGGKYLYRSAASGETGSFAKLNEPEVDGLTAKYTSTGFTDVSFTEVNIGMDVVEGPPAITYTGTFCILFCMGPKVVRPKAMRFF